MTHPRQEELTFQRIVALSSGLPSVSRIWKWWMPAFAVVGVRPDDLLVAASPPVSLTSSALGVVAGDDRVAVRQPLHAAGVVDRLAGQVVVASPARPSLPSWSTSMTRLPERAADQRVAVVRRIAVNGMCGVFTSQTTLPFGVVLADDLVEQLRHEVVAVGELAGHARLQVVVLRLGLERHLDDDLARRGRLRAAAACRRPR